MVLQLRWFPKRRTKRAVRRSAYTPAIEQLEDRALLSASTTTPAIPATVWNQLNGNAQHTGVSQAVAQPLNQVLWSVSLDLEPWGAEHYGDPIFTSNNTVIVPIKVTWSAQDQNAQNFFLEGVNDVTGQVLWTTEPTGTITGASNAGPIVISGSTTGLVNGDSVTIGGVNGNTAANGTFTIEDVTANSFQLQGTSGNGAYSGGGTWVLNPSNQSSYIDPNYGWLPPYQPVYDAGTNRVYFAGPGGTLDYISNPDQAGTPTIVQEAFYGTSNYLANESAYNSSIYTNTGLTIDNAGNVYFGFTVTGSNPSGITDGGVVKVTPSGVATDTLAYSAVGQSNDGNWNPAEGASAAVSNDGSIVYFGINDSGYGLNGNGEYNSYLVGFNTTTMAPVSSVQLLDPASGQGAGLIDESTASPMVAPDGTVFQGVFGNPYNGSRGYLLHFSGDLSTEYTPGAFGWDDTPSIIPASMVPSYTGTSTYLILSKYNNYSNADFGGPNSGDYGDNGVNEIAVLDPNSAVPDPNYDPNNPNPGFPNPNFKVMATVEAFTSPSPDVPAVQAGDPDAVREWCTNGTVVDPATDSVFMNNEDGYTYEWNLGTNTVTDAVEVTSGIGVPYTPTAIAPNGEIFSDNGGELFAEGGYTNYTINTAPSVDPAVVGNTITLTTTLASTNGGPTPTGTVTFSYYEGANNPLNYDTTAVPIGTANIVDGVASIQVSGLVADHYHIYASYSGDSTYSPGQTILDEPVLETVTTSVTSSANPISQGTGITLTATVSPNGSSFVPIGTVSFYDGSTLLGTANLNNLDNEANPNPDQTTTLNVSSLPGGTNSITAVYSGDLNFTTGTSTAYDEYVPAVANPGTQNSAVGDTVSLQVQASGLAPSDTWTFSATGLPSGLSINASSGLITGTITGSAESYSATVTANDGQGDEPSQSFTWNVSVLSETNPGTQNGAVGDSVSLAIATTGLPTCDSWTYSASGLPSGLSINASSGLITGTITGSANTYSPSVTAGDGESASVSQSFTWNVSTLSVTNPGSQNSALGAAVSLQIHASGLPTGDTWTYSASGLPSGLSINASSGLITGTISGSPNTYASSVTASDGQGASTTQAFSWSVGATTTTLAASVDPSTYGQKVTFTATVAPVVTGSTKPTGSVQFLDGTTVLATVTLSTAGKATYTTTAFALAVGGDSITAVYSGNTKFETSTSAILTQTVKADPAAISVKTSDATTVFGQSVTFTAIVASTSPGSGTPTGTVTFYDGSTPLMQETLSSGRATYSTSGLPLGSNSITVVYSGDGNYVGGTSTAISQTVNQAATKTVVKSSGSPSAFGQNVTFTATVTVKTPGSGTPNGSVIFYDGSTELGPGTLNGSGQATYSTSSLAVGTHSITAVYQGATDFGTSTSIAINQKVNKAATTSSVGGPSDPPANTQVTFTATVVPTAPGSVAPTGTVTFYSGSTALGTVAINSQGQATLPVTFKKAGTYKITVKYSGDANFAASTSATFQETVS
jgi:hypothetical protein